MKCSESRRQAILATARADDEFLLRGLVRTVQLLAANPGPRPKGSEIWRHFGTGRTWGHADAVRP